MNIAAEPIIEILPNGLTVILEPMSHFESVSIELHVPGGLIYDDPTMKGTSLLFSDLVERGVEGYDSRALSDAFDKLGARHGTSTGSDRFVYRATALKDVLQETLALLSLKVLAPTFPEQEILPIKDLLIMDARSVDDNPARRTNMELSKRFMPEPYNRQSVVDLEAVDRISRDAVVDLQRRCVMPKGAILSLAGNFNPTETLRAIASLFSSWEGQGPALPEFQGIQPASQTHLQRDTSQVQICLAYPSAKFGDHLYYAAKVANEILSGGMFGRLFIEVREKRGLCYSVYSRHQGGRFAGSVSAYSGTTPDRAKETLTVMMDTIKGLHGTVTQEELARAKANLQSSLVIGEESAASRAGSNAGDYWLSGRVRTLAEVSDAISQTTAADIDQTIEAYNPSNYTLVTLGSTDITK
jgi:predicted Zn-dependent peptidase